MQAEDRLEVERLGGLAGFGGTRSRLKSRGHVMGDQLSAAEREQIARLFAQPTAADPGADGFRYRLTLTGASVEVPESALPAVVRDCVSDELI